ncbi:Anaphase-promoting complex subunit 1 [Thelohanellus kitauei]|uniref:Anaphase-promoting complex subunit 1 n=1 Tax=Thelohanellus kitauei TaxID=669202 RepID=A0A0C2MBQ9_THEKT|nr:Anaphase-promoting complex subunit 1 [Thelohanellus kitauei]
MNEFTFETLQDTKWVDYDSKRTRIGKAVYGGAHGELRLYYELEWAKNNVHLKKYTRESLVPYESAVFETDFDIKKVVICEFQPNVFSFCCAGSTKITHFNEKLGYTTRVLPFEISDIYFVQENPGLVFVSFGYFNKYYFWLNPTLNDLFPINLLVGKNMMLLNQSMILFCDEHGKTRIFCDFDGTYHSMTLTTKDYDYKGQDSTISNVGLVSSVVSNDYSYLNLSKYDQNQIIEKNVFNHSGVIYRGFENQESIIHSLLGDQKSGNMSRDLFLLDKVVCIEKDTASNFRFQNPSADPKFLPVLTTDFAGNRFIFFRSRASMTIKSIDDINSPMVQIDHIKDIIFLHELHLVVLLDTESNIYVLSGNTPIYTFHKGEKQLEFVSKRYDLIIFRSQFNQFVLMKIYAFGKFNHMVKMFFECLKIDHPKEAKVLFDLFMIYLFQHSQSSQNLCHSFSDSLCRYFGVEMKEINEPPLSVIRLRNSMKPVPPKPRSNYIEIVKFLNDEQLIIFCYLLRFRDHFAQKFFFDYTSLNSLDTVLESVYSGFSVIAANFKTKQNISVQEMFDSSLDNFTFGSKEFTFTQSKLFSGCQICIIRPSCSEFNKKRTIFPFRQVDPLTKDERFSKTREKLNWGAVHMSVCTSVDLFPQKYQPGYPSLEEPFCNGDFTQRSFFMITLNIVLSKPIGMGILDFGIGVRNFCDLSFESIKNKFRPSIKFRIFREKEFTFPLFVEVQENELNPKSVEWPNFHNGTCMAITSIKSYNIEDRNIRGTATTENWLKQAVECLNPAECGGFVFGCGLLGQLYSLPVDSSGFLLNLFLRSDQTCLAGVLLGLGVSHFKSHKLDSLPLVRRLQRIFLIHSGLPYSSSEESTKRDQMVMDLFEFENSHSQIGIHAQSASLISLGMVYFGSGDPLILKTMRAHFNRMLDKASRLKPIKGHIRGFTATTDVIYNSKTIAPVLGMSIGLVNCKRQMNDFSWSDYYGSLISRLKSADHSLVHFLESTYIMIGLTYIRTNNENAAKLLETPREWITKMTVKPSLLMLANWWWGLIMDEYLVPIPKYIYHGLDPLVRSTINIKSSLAKESRDSEYINCYAIMTGRLFALCCKYASTCDQKVYTMVRRIVNKLAVITEKRISIELFQPRSENIALNSFLALLVLGLCVVFAGSCSTDLKVLVQKMRTHFTPKLCNSEVMVIANQNYFLSHFGASRYYGVHLALNMGHGFLCLSNGFMSLTTSSLSSYCMLIISLYPSLPQTASDNFMYFQPLRHLYTLACTRTRVAMLIDEHSTIRQNQVLNIIFHKGSKIKSRRAYFTNPFPIQLPYVFNKLEIDFPSREKIIIPGSVLLETPKSRIFDLGEWHRIYIKPRVHGRLAHVLDPITKELDISHFIQDSYAILFQNNRYMDALFRGYVGKIPLPLINTLFEMVVLKNNSATHGSMVEYIRKMIDQVMFIGEIKPLDKITVPDASNIKDFEIVKNCIQFFLDNYR